MDYKEKYLKYKLKYLNAKKLYGGMEKEWKQDSDEDNMDRWAPMAQSSSDTDDEDFDPRKQKGKKKGKQDKPKSNIKKNQRQGKGSAKKLRTRPKSRGRQKHEEAGPGPQAQMNQTSEGAALYQATIKAANDEYIKNEFIRHNLVPRSDVDIDYVDDLLIASAEGPGAEEDQGVIPPAAEAAGNQEVIPPHPGIVWDEDVEAEVAENQGVIPPEQVAAEAAGAPGAEETCMLPSGIIRPIPNSAAARTARAAAARDSTAARDSAARRTTAARPSGRGSARAGIQLSTRRPADARTYWYPSGNGYVRGSARARGSATARTAASPSGRGSARAPFNISGWVGPGQPIDPQIPQIFAQDPTVPSPSARGSAEREGRTSRVRSRTPDGVGLPKKPKSRDRSPDRYH